MTSNIRSRLSSLGSRLSLKMSIRTKKDAAYPVPETYSNGTDLSNKVDDRVVCDCRQERYLKCIIPRDHYFDTQERARRSCKVKPFKFSCINDPARGDLPIRSQYGYRLNEAKVFQSNLVGLKFSADT